MKLSHNASQATGAADQVAVESARLRLSFCRITSPIQGRAGKLLVDLGNSVKGNETVLAVVNQARPVCVDLLVPEGQLPVIQEEMRKGRFSVTAMVPGDSATPAARKLLFVDNTADQETAMVALRAGFANEAETLWPGETVEVTLTLTTLSSVVVVPSSAVQVGLAEPYLLLVRPDLCVEWRPLTTSIRVGRETISWSGIKDGEELVTSGRKRVTPGKQVKIHAHANHSLVSAPRLLNTPAMRTSPSNSACRSSGFILSPLPFNLPEQPERNWRTGLHGV